MTLDELANKEDELYRKVMALYDQPQSGEAKLQLQEIWAGYKTVHQQYAKLSPTDMEALKRGLFIQWYQLTEPPYLTGIGDLDMDAREGIIQALNKVIAAGKIDAELAWMLNYYTNWEWHFEGLHSFQGFDPKIVNQQNNHLPEKIDNDKMEQRGQMGKYWNSLTQFSRAQR